jgi:thiamine monophosphate synthase
VSLRLLAIAPPSGPIDLGVLEVWREAGLHEVAVLLREPGARPGAVVTGRLAPLRGACAAAGLRVLVAVDVDAIAAAIDTVVAHDLAGIQLRGDPDRESLVRARDGLGGRLLGRSVHGRPDALQDVADYTCFAPVFTPRTAPRKPAAGLPALHAWAAVPGAWVVALGGIEPANARACVEAGARGLASISAFFDAPRVDDLRALAMALG